MRGKRSAGSPGSHGILLLSPRWRLPWPGSCGRPRKASVLSFASSGRRMYMAVVRRLTIIQRHPVLLSLERRQRRTANLGATRERRCCRRSWIRPAEKLRMLNELSSSCRRAAEHEHMMRRLRRRRRGAHLLRGVPPMPRAGGWLCIATARLWLMQS